MDEFSLAAYELLKVMQGEPGLWSARMYGTYTRDQVSDERAAQLLERLNEDGLVERTRVADTRDRYYCMTVAGEVYLPTEQ
jgi:DNA-binding PadR family transcriptional regulator